MNDEELGVIILAAGSSARMGQSKQLLLIKNEPLLLRTVNTVIDSGIKNIVVVLGAHSKEHHSIIKHLPVEIVFNDSWQKGMGNSLKAGLRNLIEKSPNTESVLILVCDQPLLNSPHIQRLKDYSRSREKDIVASSYAGTLGVPVLFSRALFDQLLNLRDEHGAKKIIESNQERVVAVPFPEGETDLDTPEDYRNFINSAL